MAKVHKLKKTFTYIISFTLVLTILASFLPIRGYAKINLSVISGDYKLIALTFDDGPGRYTEELLDGLKERGAKATFFMCGYMVVKYPEAVERMAREGHQLANHTTDHKNLVKLDAEGIKQQVDGTDDLFTQVAGDDTYYIRPPYGNVNDLVKETVEAPLILWSVDPQDWKYRDKNAILNNIMKKAGDGDIVLLHDIHRSSVEAALAVVDKLQAKGYEFVTVSELFRRRGVVPENGEVYTKARNNGINLGPALPETAVSQTGGKKDGLQAGGIAHGYVPVTGGSGREQEKYLLRTGAVHGLSIFAIAGR